jgi:hypothetical protein
MTDTGSEPGRQHSPRPTPAVRSCPRGESTTDVRLDGDEMAADADDGDAGHYSRTYMSRG